MDKELLREIGVILYGPNFRSPMARYLGVSDRTVRRWLGGEFEVSDGHISALLRMLYTHVGKTLAVSKKLEQVSRDRYRRYVQEVRRR